MMGLRVELYRGLDRQQSFDFSGTGPIRIGRQRDQDIVVPSVSVGRQHAEIVSSPSGYVIRDLGSLVGTRVNGRPVVEHGPLKAGDDIQIAGWRLRIAQERVSQLVQDAPVSEPSSKLPTELALQTKDGPTDLAHADLFQGLSDALRTGLDQFRRDWSAMSDQAIRAECRRILLDLITSEHPQLGEAEIRELVLAVTAEVVGLGVLERHLADPSVSEIMVNATDQIFVERSGRCIQVSDRFSSQVALRTVIERMFIPLGKRIDDASPLGDGRLPDGSRINAVLSPPAVGSHCITIRKFFHRKLGFADLVGWGSLSEEMGVFLAGAIQARKNIIISGGTGSGKTTLLRLLAENIPSHERMITVEDAAELNLKTANIVSLEARPANQEGEGQITIRDLVKTALRMRPDRIVVGECRGGEAIDMLQAMNTGHEGSLTTVHANHPRDVLSRLEVMVLMSGFDIPIQAIREQISSAVDLIVHQKRFSDGRRRVTHIEEICGLESGVVQSHPIFHWVDSEQCHRRVS